MSNVYPVVSLDKLALRSLKEAGHDIERHSPVSVFNQPSDSCFAYDQKNETKYSKYGMFDASCYNKEKLNDKDYVYFRQIRV